MESETTSSSEILWMEILSRIPFVKSDNPGENKIRIDSKNQVEEEDAMQLEQWISNQEVIISHSCTMHPLQFCRGIVESFEYEEKILKVTVSTESDAPIWEDTDIWMFSTPNCFSFLFNQTEPNTSVADLDPIQEEEDECMPSTGTESDDEKLFKSINGWKLVGKKGYRERRKVGEHWKNVYFTELEVTPVDSMEMFSLRDIKVGTPLRFSDDIEEPGDVLVDVVRKNIEEGSIFTIVLGVTGFAQTDVNIPLSKEQTYYLNLDDGDFDETASVASEHSVLSGYPLHMNIDELCEKLGKLTFTDACIKSWLDPNGNIPFIRLIVTSDRKMQNFKLLTGHHVIIQSEYSRSSVSAVVSKVMKDEMILTLRGVQKDADANFFFSKTQLFTIQIDHSYENWLKELTGEQRVLEDLRQQIANGETDIRRLRVREEKKGDQMKTYATFASRIEANAQIPIGTRVLLGKTWEVERMARRNADFVFAIRVEDDLCPTQAIADHFVTFEIIHSRNLVLGAPEFELTKAFYFVDFDSHQQVAESQFYSPLNARDPNLKKHQTVATNNMISKEIKFTVSPLQRDRKPYDKKQNLQNKPSPLKLNFVQKPLTRVQPQPPSSPSVSSIKSDDKKQKKGGNSTGKGGGGGQKNNCWKSPQTPTNNNNKSFQKNMELAVALYSRKMITAPQNTPQKGYTPKLAPPPKGHPSDGPPKDARQKDPVPKLAPPPQGHPPYSRPKDAPKQAPEKNSAPKLDPPPLGPQLDGPPKDAPQKDPAPPKHTPWKDALQKNTAPKLAPPPQGSAPPPPPPQDPQEAPSSSQPKALKKQQERNLDAEKRELKKVIDADEPWKVLGQIDEKHKRLCYVYITRYKGNDPDIVNLCAGLDEHGEPTKTAPWRLGNNIVLTASNGTEIKLNGQVYDTKKIPGRGFDQNRHEDDRHGLCEQAAE